MNNNTKPNETHIVYIKQVSRATLPKNIAAHLPDDWTQPLFAIYTADGAPLSLSQSYQGAKAAAREYNLEPYSIH